MNRIITTILSALFFTASSVYASSIIEKEFKQRLHDVIVQGHFSTEALKGIWLIEDDHTQTIVSTQECLRTTNTRGLSRIRIDKLSPIALEKIKQISSCDGADCRLNLEPKSIATIISKDETQWSVVLGEMRGKLYIIGHKKQIKAVVDNSVRASLSATL